MILFFSGGSHIGLRNMAVPLGANLGTHLKMIKYGMDNICAKFGEFARI